MPARHEELETWVVTHILKHYPDLTLEDRKQVYRHSQALRQGYATLHAAQDTGEPGAIAHAARAVYLAWVSALEATSRDTSETPVAPATEESPFQQYQSATLGDAFLLSPDASHAQPYWEHPSALVAYTPEELSLLQHLRTTTHVPWASAMTLIHTCKQLFGGHLVPAPHHGEKH